MSNTPVPPRGGKRGGGSNQPRRRPSARSAEIARRKRNRNLGIGSVAVVVVVIVVLVVVKVAGGGSSSTASGDVSPSGGTPIPAAQLGKLQSLPLSVLADASASGLYPSITTPKGGVTSLTAGGKPELLYIGAEFCPFCAAERWALYIALAKFGTFTVPPGRIHSSVVDNPSSLPTLTFYGSKYVSKYFTFDPRETYTNGVDPKTHYYYPLDSVSSSEFATWKANNGNSFPFIDFGGKLVLDTAQYPDTDLAGQTFNDVVDSIGDNTMTIGRNIDAAANVLVQTICKSLTNGQPANVCKAAGG